MNKTIRLLVVLCAIVSQTVASSVGKSAIVTLEFPAGAENTGLGEVGVSYAATPYSVFWNPANVASLYDYTYANETYASFDENLLPEIITGIDHRFQSLTSGCRKVFPYIDIGHAYFRNQISDRFVDSLWDSTGYYVGKDTATFNETVTGNSFGVRAFDLVSLGFSTKNYRSRMTSVLGGDGYTPFDEEAHGRAYDIGLRVNRDFSFNELVELKPAFGISAINIWGDSAKYTDTSSEKDPLPRKMFVGMSCEINVLDLLGYTFIHEYETTLLGPFNEEWRDRTVHTGYKIQLSPFYAILNGQMDDSIGQRYEISEGYVLSFNLQKVFDMAAKVKKFWDVVNNTDNYRKVNAWREGFSYLGVEFKPNIMVSKSHSKIVNHEPTHVRDGQTRDDWTVGIGVVAGFPNHLNPKEAKHKAEVKEPVKAEPLKDEQMMEEPVKEENTPENEKILKQEDTEEIVQ